MPLYLVRWPSLTATLIRAGSEAELMDVIDEVGTPGVCTWNVYRGPLMIDFTVPIESTTSPGLRGRATSRFANLQPTIANFLTSLNQMAVTRHQRCEKLSFGRRSRSSPTLSMKTTTRHLGD